MSRAPIEVTARPSRRRMRHLRSFELAMRMAGKRPPILLARREHVGARLKATREALGIRPVEICQELDIQQNKYSQWENGKSRPNLDDMIRFCERYDVALDWIYRGDPSKLPREIYSAVMRTMQQESSGSPRDQLPVGNEKRQVEHSDESGSARRGRSTA